MFRQAYSPGPVCAPVGRLFSVASILPGHGMSEWVEESHHSPTNAPVHAFNPWDRGSLTPKVVNLAQTLRKHGYVTGHSGKWHLGKTKGTQPTQVGFDWSRENHGIQNVTGFASTDDDPFRLDDNGFPRHQNSEDALIFVRENYCTFLVQAVPYSTSTSRNWESSLPKFTDQFFGRTTGLLPRANVRLSPRSSRTPGWKRLHPQINQEYHLHPPGR